MRPLLVVLLLLLVIGLLPVWPYSAAWGVGFFPSGLLGLLLVVLIVAALLRAPRQGRLP